jgi:hypothetical protein
MVDGPFKQGELLSKESDLFNLNTITSINHRFDLNTDIQKYYDEDGYLVLGIFRDAKDVVHHGPELTYRVNRQGFRSKHFQKLDPNKINILYAGCSWTFGEGIVEEHAWSNILSNKIQEHCKKEVDYHNVSAMGASPHLIIKNVMAFIRNYGKPDYLFIEMSDHSRAITYSSQAKAFFRRL